MAADCLNGGKWKAEAAAARLKLIFPEVVSVAEAVTTTAALEGVDRVERDGSGLVDPDAGPRGARARDRQGEGGSATARRADRLARRGLHRDRFPVRAREPQPLTREQDK